MQPKYEFESEVHTVEPLRQRDDLTLSIDGQAVDVRIERRDAHHSELSINGQRHEVFSAQDGDRLFIHLDGHSYVVEAISEFASAGGAAGGGEGTISAPMPGVVIDYQVATGDAVTEGQTVMMIESMKLQTEIRAKIAGIVGELPLAPGQAFDKGARLLEIIAEGVDQGEPK